MYEIIFIAILGVIAVVQSLRCIYLLKKKNEAYKYCYQKLNELLDCYTTVQFGISRFNEIYDVQLSFHREKDSKKYIFSIKDPEDGELFGETSTDCCKSSAESTQN